MAQLCKVCEGNGVIHPETTCTVCQLKKMAALAEELAGALQAVYEHLEYYGWGDNWERELAQRINSALSKWEESNRGKHAK